MYSGVICLIAAVILFGYYTTWVFVLPFIPTEAAVHEFFPPAEYAFAIPAVGLALTVLGAICVVLFPSKFDVRSAAAKPKQQ